MSALTKNRLHEHALNTLQTSNKLNLIESLTQTCLNQVWQSLRGLICSVSSTIYFTVDLLTSVRKGLIKKGEKGQK